MPERTIYRLILAFQKIPKVAVAPLLIIWFGYGVHSKIVIAASIAFFPILVNMIVGLKSGDVRRITLMRALRASPLQIYTKVILPSMLPFLFAGIEVGIVFSLIGAIVGELLGASVGLGSFIIQRQAYVDVAGVFSILTYLLAVGLTMSMLVRPIASKMTFLSHLRMFSALEWQAETTVPLRELLPPPCGGASELRVQIRKDLTCSIRKKVSLRSTTRSRRHFPNWGPRPFLA